MTIPGSQNAWLPDWTQAGQYPKQNAGLHNWRWEFVRRNEEYQADWSRLIEPHFDFQRHSFGDHADFAHFRRKYGLLIPPDPAEASPGNCFGQDWFSGSSVAGAGTQKVRFDLTNCEIAAIFDLRRPLQFQFEKAKRFLRGQQQMFVDGGMDKPLSMKPQKAKFPLYLRMLDAVASGATQAQIATCLFPNMQGESKIQRVKDGLRHARHMRDVGFLDIPSR